MTSAIRRAVRRVRSRLHNAAHPDLLSTMQHEKGSVVESPFAELLSRLGDPGTRTLFHELNPAKERVDELAARLTGQTRNTSFRHRMQDMDAGEVLREISSPTTALNLIYLGARHAPPGWRAELGSAFGIGTMALCLAERATANPVDGVEFEAWRAEIADEGATRLLPDRAHVHAGRIEDHLPTLAPERPRLGFAFVDAMHTFDATTGYHRLLASDAAPGAWALYDDLAWSPDMERAWRHIVQDDSVTDAIRIDRRWGLVRYAGSTE